MSSVPPNVPPGYDPKAQWRAYREQQRAEGRAQRDAWRAQRQAYKASYYGVRVPSVVGPIVLVGIGIVALLLVTGHLDSSSFWGWYGQWWPLLLIAAGLALLGEWALDMRRKTPVRRTGSFVGVLILLAILGTIATGHNHLWGPWNNHFGDGNFFNTFGQPEHDSDPQPSSVQAPANASIDIQNPRGNVSITTADQTAVTIQPHLVAYAGSDSAATRIFDSEGTHSTVSGNSVQIKTDENSRGRVDLSITVPKSAHVSVNAGWGDVTAAGLGAGFEVTARGDVHISSIVGPVVAHFVNGRHDEFAAHDVQGDLTLEGDVNDLTLSQIKGNITQNGNILGDVHVEDVSGATHIHTSRTTVEIPSLTGDMTFDSDDLRVTGAKGDVRVATRSKDIDLSQIAGDTYVQDENGTINVAPTGTYGVEARNHKGDLEITLPSDVSANVTGHTHNGDIESDFALNVTGDEDKSVAGKIGAGSARITLDTDNGDIHIKRGTTSSEASAKSGASDESGAKHLKSKKSLPEQPVAQ